MRNQSLVFLKQRMAKNTIELFEKCFLNKSKALLKTINNKRTLSALIYEHQEH